MQGTAEARLELEDGSVFTGVPFGCPRSSAGEVVFTTGMAGYPQSLTDPSFRGQILVCTYPLVGNYGVPVNPETKQVDLDSRGIPLNFESERVQVSGLVLSEVCKRPSHYASGATLSAWLAAEGVPGIAGVDTRALTTILRERGALRGRIIVEGDVSFESGDLANPVSDVSPKAVRVYEADVPAPGAERPVRLALMDCGVKANILRCLVHRGVTIIRVPWDHDLSGIEHDGLFLSNGPGDPKACAKTIATVRRAMARGKPIFGICLGNQIMALAAGADTYKLPYGHRGQNQPCVEVGTKRCYITSQNHGYAVKADTLPRGWEVWFTNGNDGTVEGIRSTRGPFRAVQYHPEGCPGPKDSEFLIDEFLDQVRKSAGLKMTALPGADVGCARVPAEVRA